MLEEDPFAVGPIELNDIGVWGTVFERAICSVERGWKAA